eukprot:GHVU01223258.1.p1 GENE.GHVU01223258.1~~GHVU01223258.1.p1  ORF type:complete len:122 (+),score=18.94 GHVU01223258.1:492-857(+)
MGDVDANEGEKREEKPAERKAKFICAPEIDEQEIAIYRTEQRKREERWRVDSEIQEVIWNGSATDRQLEIHFYIMTMRLSDCAATHGPVRGGGPLPSSLSKRMKLLGGVIPPPVCSSERGH